ncbi:MAG: hypothetical protein U0T11_04690 [Chitinophagaceae bacterium]
MISQENLEFVEWWEKNRDRERNWMNQLTIGLPLGLVFGLPVLLSVMFRGWYKRMPYISGSQFTLILMACLGIAVFYAVFRMRFKWEMNEQRYLELKKQMNDSGE